MRFGLVGYGFGGRYFHAPLLAAAPEIDFAGVVTRSPDRRAELAKEHPGAAAYDSLSALAADGAQAVAISTPADTHIPLALEAIRLGLAVVVDKPFALDAAEARTALEAASQAGVPISVYQNRRWDSDLLTVRRLIDTGALGDVTRFESRFERFAPDPGPPAAGGGNLRDFGAHLVDQALLLFGPAEHVYARMSARDDDFFVSIQHTGGVDAQLWGSWVQGAPGPRFRVTGTTGTYIVGGVDGQEEQLIAGRTPATEGDRWGAEPAERWGHVYRGGAGEVVPTERGRWDTYYPAFAAAVRGEAPLPVDPWDVVRNIEVLDAARESAATGRTITL
ncbi:Predicted dehydrogenase [Asanoa hainanensis]|uniref:Predicted dehydrogenase n=1 Tax=Asanoa hainanensis TaxID=560556 RepID=A0A239GAN7_9ACTN|nr:Gfo/Idh/MocA family oxidoreductase [Asanoa hainanensis]SNS65782.1 Predicted dehydrogenase [Asanoa hainanensis]